MISADPYDAFLAEQKKREAEWASNRANKKAKTMETATKDLEAIKQQLAAKEAECANLKGQLESLQRANVSVVEAVHNKVQESFCKVSTVSPLNCIFKNISRNIAKISRSRFLRQSSIMGDIMILGKISLNLNL